MSTSTLDKATDKMINLMTPDELAKYADGFVMHMSQRVGAGQITSEEGDEELDLFVQKYVNRLSPISHIRYVDASHRALEKNLVALLTESHLKNFDFRMSVVELLINARTTMDMWYSALCRKEHPSDVAEKMIEEAVLETRENVAGMFQQLDDIKKEQEEYLAHPAWEKHGIVLEAKERESLLLPMVWLRYAP